MDRRAFLGLLGGAVVAARIPVSLLQGDGDYCIRYIRAFDVRSGKMINRIDVARFELSLPNGVDSAHKISKVPPGYISKAANLLKTKKGLDPAAIAALENASSGMGRDQFISVSYPG